MKPLTICLCTTFYPPNSTNEDGLYVQRLANALAEAGHAVTVVHNPAASVVIPSSERRTPNSDHESIRNVPVSNPAGLAGVLALHQSGRPLGITSKLRNIFAQNFDVLHYHNVSLLGGPGIFALADASLKVATLNDHWLVCPTHLLWKWNETVCESRQCLKCCLRKRKLPQLWRTTGLMRKMTSHIDAFIGPSRLTIDAHRDRGLHGPIIHLPTFYTPPSTRCDAGAKPPVDGNYFLCAGRLEPHKGFGQVVSLFRDLPQHSLVVCGDGSQVATLRRIAGDATNIVFLNRASAHEADLLYQHATATIVPTLGYQTFCHTTAESFARGTPVIGRQQGVVKELIDVLDGGLLYKNDRELRRHIESLATDEKLRTRLSTAAQHAFTTELSPEVYVRRYVDLIGALRNRKKQVGSIRPTTARESSLAGRAVEW